MCSIYEDGQTPNLIENKIIDNTNDHQCRKCNVNTAAIRLRGKDFYCKDCFLITVTHKFRATLGKSKIVKSSDTTILVAYSGDSKSTTLLHLIKTGMHKSVHKRLVFNIKVLFIDEDIVNQENVDARQQNILQISKRIEALGFTCYFLSLGDALYKSPSIKPLETNDYCIKLNNNNHNDEYVKTIFNKLSNKTSKIDFIKKLKNQLMLITAKRLNCTKIFVGDDLHSLAVDILSNISLGRGSQLSSDIGFIDQRDPDVMILRPLKDFSTHEVDYYMQIHELVAINTKNSLQSTNSGVYLSIQELTNQFVTGLEATYGGTVSTIYRTGEKMTTATTDKNKYQTDSCVFCNSLLDPKSLDDGVSASDATRFSRIISREGFHTQVTMNNSSDKEIKCISHCEGNCNKRESKADENVNKCLCYGCRLIFQCNFDSKAIPEFILEKCQERVSLDNMKEQIQDFLL